MRLVILFKFMAISIWWLPHVLLPCCHKNWSNDVYGCLCKLQYLHMHFCSSYMQRNLCRDIYRHIICSSLYMLAAALHWSNLGYQHWNPWLTFFILCFCCFWSSIVAVQPVKDGTLKPWRWLPPYYQYARLMYIAKILLLGRVELKTRELPPHSLVTSSLLINCTIW